MNVKTALHHAKDIDLLDAQVLLAHVLRTSRAALYSADDRDLTDNEQQQWTLLLSKRKEGVPVAYLMGEKECMGLLFEVTPDVLIPRPDTECLINTALSLLKPNAQVLDVGTGSGVIACSIAYFKPDCHLIATDISEAALNIAQRNIDKHQLNNVTLLTSDLFENIHTSFDMIVSNPPYLSDDDPYLSGEIRFEPAGALIADENGLGILHRVIKDARTHLNPGGYLCLEHGYQQGAHVQDLLAQYGFEQIKTVKDLSGHERVTFAH
jgi:release factor glutamine methyltransferase